MCMCKNPTINGSPGYRWNDEREMVYPPNPPALIDGDSLLYDEAGRCAKGIDSHSEHYRLVKNGGRCFILGRNGGGDTRIPLEDYAGVLLPAITAMDSNTRYFFFNAMYGAYRNSATLARDCERAKWTWAILEKRIKVRRKGGCSRVEVSPRIVMA